MIDDNLKKKSSRTGIIYGLASFIFWGLSPLYFKVVSEVPPLEILGHRIFWSIVLLLILALFSKNWSSIAAAFRDKKTIFTLVATTIFVTTNWFVFIYAIASNQVLQASLGYFINPLVSILLGMIFLRERLSKWGFFAVFLAFTGVLFQVIKGIGLPWIALVLAFSFGFYGLLRKIVKVNAIVGLTVETALLGPIAFGYLLLLGVNGTGHFGAVSWQLTVLLSLAGLITTLPLIWFTKAARRLNLSTIGFMQYAAPSINFVIALAYGEAFTLAHAVSFGCIWTALAIYSIDSARHN